MGHKRFGDKSRTGVHYRSSSCTDDAGDDGDLVFFNIDLFFRVVWTFRHPFR